MTSEMDSHCQFDPSLQSEDIAFKQSELIECKGCSRRNGPERATCVYCGKDLENPNATKLNLRKLESWEPGFSVVARQMPSEQAALNTIATLLGLEKERVAEVATAAGPMPLTRVETATQADALCTKLNQLGGNFKVIEDAELAVDRPPVRLKRIDIDEDEIVLIDLNSDNVYCIEPKDILLIVTGRLITSRTDLLEKRRRSGKSDLLDEISTSSDESVADIYTSGDAQGFRVRPSGFDFSCLGDERKLVAAGNFRSLIGRLTTIAGNAKVVDYAPIRRFLDDVWEPDSRKDTQGMKSAGLGKKGFGSVVTTSNYSQFTKFSRMHWHLLRSV